MSREGARLVLVLAAVTLAVAGSSRLGAQGLGDAAGREKQKRQQRRDSRAEPVKAFSDQDLEAAKAAAEAAKATAEAAAGPAAADAKPSGRPGADGGGEPSQDPLERERQERALQRAEWRVRFANAREQLALAEAASWHEVVRTEFQAGIPVQMKIKEQFDTPELKRARKALADLEEEFRRTGLPPGWARPSP